MCNNSNIYLLDENFIESIKSPNEIKLKDIAFKNYHLNESDEEIFYKMNGWREILQHLLNLRCNGKYYGRCKLSNEFIEMAKQLQFSTNEGEVNIRELTIAASKYAYYYKVLALRSSMVETNETEVLTEDSNIYNSTIAITEDKSSDEIAVVRIGEKVVHSRKETKDPKKRGKTCIYCDNVFAEVDTSCAVCNSEEFKYNSIKEEADVNQSNSPTNEINNDCQMETGDFSPLNEVETEPIKEFIWNTEDGESEAHAYVNSFATNKSNDNSKIDIEPREGLIEETKEGPKPIDEFILQEDTKVSQDQVLAPKENKWKCLKCGFTNSFKMDYCQVCFVESPHKGQWSCDACSYYNEAHATECCVCGATKQRPVVKSVHVPTPGIVPERICWFHGCQCRNKVGERFCKACGLDQEGARRLGVKVFIKATNNKIESIWICSSCSRFNECSEDRCSGCPNRAESRDTTPCPGCKFNIKKGSKMCQFCNTNIN